MPCNLMQHSSLPKVAMKGMKPNVQITGFHDASVVAKKADPGLTQGKLRTFTCINTKETSILKKLKRQVRKEDNMALLANDIHL
ncbi:hypothetical protein KP509_22G041100 [Ceratopteris richardii]|nr:hypothetical protein KP509_22G041100 [Ceratopteris richardii]